jgi:hypothetical protein
MVGVWLDGGGDEQRARGGQSLMAEATSGGLGGGRSLMSEAMSGGLGGRRSPMADATSGWLGGGRSPTVVTVRERAGWRADSGHGARGQSRWAACGSGHVAATGDCTSSSSMDVSVGKREGKP